MGMSYASYEILYAIDQLENTGEKPQKHAIWERLVENRIKRNKLTLAQMAGPLRGVFGALTRPASFLQKITKGPQYRLFSIRFILLQQDALIRTVKVPNEDPRTKDMTPYIKQYSVTYFGHRELEKKHGILPENYSVA